MEDSRKIQEYIMRNKAEFDYERIKEWRERKQMKVEDETMRKKCTEENSHDE